MTSLLLRALLVAILAITTATASSTPFSSIASLFAGAEAPKATPAAKQHEGTVLFDGSSYSFHRGILNSSEAVVTGRFVDGLNVTGWGELWLSTSASFADDVQMYAAGYLEGALTHWRIEQMYEITVAGLQDDATIKAFVDTQSEWVAAQVKHHSANNTYWAGIGLIQQQYAGLQAGYNTHVMNETSQLSRYQFDQLQMAGDWGDVWYATHRSQRPNFSNMTADQTKRYLTSIGHCSVLVKVTADLSEIYGAHSTWYEYATMNRIFKHYNLRLQASYVAAQRVSFSSYPGYLESLDDFYYGLIPETPQHTTASPDHVCRHRHRHRCALTVCVVVLCCSRLGFGDVGDDQRLLELQSVGLHSAAFAVRLATCPAGHAERGDRLGVVRARVFPQ